MCFDLPPQIDTLSFNEDELLKRLSDYEKAMQNGYIQTYDENQSIGMRQILLSEKQPSLWSVSLNQDVEVECNLINFS